MRAIQREHVVAWAERLTLDQRRRLDELHELGREVLEATDARSRRRRWHDLFFAVGNLKRSAGNIHPPGTWMTPSDQEARLRPQAVPMPYGGAGPAESSLLGRDDAASWHELQRSVVGLGPATTSMVLASLWPDTHATFDRLTRLMVGALTWSVEAVQSGEHPPVVSLDSYRDWYRPRMLRLAAELSTTVWVVERGFFRFAQRQLAGRNPAVQWDQATGWAGYREKVLAAFVSVPSESSLGGRSFT